jgi:hypothetical protein
MRLLVGTIVCAGLAAASAPAASVQSTAIPPVITVTCNLTAATLFMDPPGKLRVVEYAYDAEKHVMPHSTGKVIAVADAASRTLNPQFPCQRIKNVTRRESGFAGPWPRSVQTRITCVAPDKDIGLDFQLRPIVNKAKRLTGNRIVVHQRIVANHPTPGVEPIFKKVAVANGWVTRKGGGISYAPEICSRNMYP